MTLAELDRISAFLRTLADRSAARTVPLRFGTALFNDALARVWDLNYLRVEADVDGEELASEAERLQGAAGHGHRKAIVSDVRIAERVRPELERRGWSASRTLIMIRRREPDRRADTSAVREVTLDEALPVHERGIRSEPWGTDDATVRQILAAKLVIAAATKMRVFAAFDAGEPVAACELYSDGSTAQIESVVTVEEHRGRGFGRAIVTKALQVAEDERHDVVFLLAQADDWPKELYWKLGFDAAGSVYDFLREPKAA